MNDASNMQTTPGASDRLICPAAPTPAFEYLAVQARALDFAPQTSNQIAALANIGYQLLEEIAAYRPAFQWAASPAEIVGELIEEISTPATATAQPTATRDGWKLVPIEPTEAMLLAPGALRSTGYVARIHRDIWSRMLAAAPDVGV